MADGSLGIQENRAFYQWLRQRLPGWWASEEEMITKNMAALYPEYWREWKSLKMPTRWTPPDQAPAPEAEQQEVPPPEEQPGYGGYTYEQWGMGIPEFEWQKQQKAMELAASREESLRQQEYLRTQQEQLARTGYYTGGGPNILRAQQAQEFESWRNSLLGNLSGAANEVSRWFVQHKVNPYWQPSIQTGAASQALRGAEAGGDVGAIEAAGARVSEEEGQVNAELEARQEAQRQWEAGPPTPEWMKQLGFLPEIQARLPRATGLGRVETPSGQQLTQLSPTQSDYIAGAIDWFGKGKAWRDILSEAELMQPRTPLGATSARRWTPARV